MTHSPLPWRRDRYWIEDANGSPLHEEAIDPDDAATIVTAVNAHAALVAALEEAILWDSHDDQGIPAAWLKQANAALELARKGGA